MKRQTKKGTIKEKIRGKNNEKRGTGDGKGKTGRKQGRNKGWSRAAKSKYRREKRKFMTRETGTVLEEKGKKMEGDNTEAREGTTIGRKEEYTQRYSTETNTTATGVSEWQC